MALQVHPERVSSSFGTTLVKIIQNIHIVTIHVICFCYIANDKRALFRYENKGAYSNSKILFTHKSEK